MNPNEFDDLNNIENLTWNANTIKNLSKKYKVITMIVDDIDQWRACLTVLFEAGFAWANQDDKGMHEDWFVPSVPVSPGDIVFRALVVKVIDKRIWYSQETKRENFFTQSPFSDVDRSEVVVLQNNETAKKYADPNLMLANDLYKQYGKRK